MIVCEPTVPVTIVSPAGRLDVCRAKLVPVVTAFVATLDDIPKRDEVILPMTPEGAFVPARDGTTGTAVGQLSALGCVVQLAQPRVVTPE